MKKETFVKVIDCIKKHRKKEEKFLEALDELSPNTYNEVFLYVEYEDLVLNLLIEDFNDTSDIISWWIYDTEFGEDSSMATFHVDGKEIKLTSAEELYDYLTKK